MPLSFQRIDRRVGAGNLSHKQPLGRAIGATAETIVDATAGLGHDACLLACMGWKVTAIERDPFIATMLSIAHHDAVRCAELWSVLRDGLTIRSGSAEAILESLDPRPDVVFLDPMFCAKRRGSALPKKPAQVLQALAEVGEDEPLLTAARRAADRVVVKRPTGGPPIVGDPDLVFKGRLVRYDVYLAAGSH
jgi:16S rRNA (guanine1516-N2)-methyltransferase